MVIFYRLLNVFVFKPYLPSRRCSTRKPNRSQSTTEKFRQEACIVPELVDRNTRLRTSFRFRTLVAKTVRALTNFCRVSFNPNKHIVPGTGAAKNQNLPIGSLKNRSKFGCGLGKEKSYGRPPLHKMKSWYVLLLLFTVRLVSVFVVQTFYVADEYWQSLEVAHRLTFGYGFLTWEWVQGIRSYAYPLVIAAVYKVLALLNVDTVQLLVLVPRLLQAALSAYSDYRFFVWTGRRKWALFVIIVAWFWFYVGSRTLANTLETSLTTIALSYFPWEGSKEGTTYLWPAAICCFMRPTAALIWLPLGLYHLRTTGRPLGELLLRRLLPIGLTVATLGIALDSYWHGRFIVTPYEFLRFNVLQNIGSFYGSHPWYWYLTVGLPTVLGVNTLPFLLGTIETIRNPDVYPDRKQLLITIGASLAVLSCVEHKEFRFVASLLPLCLYIAADTLVRLSYKASRTMLWAVAITILLGNAMPAWYLSTVHQRGPTDLMPHVQQIARDYKDEGDRRANILFLMPCHSTPFYSHVHENITMRILTCEPNLEGKANYKDEAARFYESPIRWLRSNVPIHPRSRMPTHLVLYEPLANQIHEVLVNYRLLLRVDNPEVNPNTGTEILISEWSRLLSQKNATVESILKRVQPAVTGRSILVYQRLLPGEENAFNRNNANDDGDGLGDDGGSGQGNVPAPQRVVRPTVDTTESHGQNRFN